MVLDKLKATDEGIIPCDAAHVDGERKHPQQ